MVRRKIKFKLPKVKCKGCGKFISAGSLTGTIRLSDKCSLCINCAYRAGEKYRRCAEIIDRINRANKAVGWTYES